MEENYYRERKVMSKLPIIIVISAVTLLLVVAIVFIIKNINKKDNFNIENDFIKVAKDYYKSHNLLPLISGQCTELTLETLMSKGIIDKVEKYNTCNKYNTKLKVCKLTSGNYQYTPILSCDVEKTEEKFTEWKIGKESDLIADSSDISFSFLGYKKIAQEPTVSIEKWADEITVDKYNTISKTTYYRYRDKEWQWQETKNEYFKNYDSGLSLAYYAVSPDPEYINSDSQTTAYKWYIQENVAQEPKKIYVCEDPDTTATKYSTNDCSENTDGKTEQVRIIYTCNSLQQDSNGKLYYIEIDGSKKCDCSSTEYGSNCAIRKSYYPSREEISNKETVYYATAPILGAIKDTSTKLNVSRYYKEVTTTTDNYYTNAPSKTAIKVDNGRWGVWTNYTTTKPKSYETREIETREKIKYQIIDSNESEWDKISEDYLTLEEMITKLKSLEYNVDSLEDINNNQDLKYELQLKYRNKNN